MTVRYEPGRQAGSAQAARGSGQHSPRGHPSPDRYTLLSCRPRGGGIAPDDYRHDLLEIALFDARGRELARESLYTAEDDEPEPNADGGDADAAS